MRIAGDNRGRSSAVVRERRDGDNYATAVSWARKAAVPAATVPAPSGAHCCSPITRLREMNAKSAHDTLELEVFEVCYTMSDIF